MTAPKTPQQYLEEICETWEDLDIGIITPEHANFLIARVKQLEIGMENCRPLNNKKSSYIDHVLTTMPKEGE